MTGSAHAAPPCAAPDPVPRRPRLALPALACDSHAHVIGPHARYPLSPARVYTPPECDAPTYRRLRETLGIQRAVLVQPSVYGTDNRLLLDALAQEPGTLRGVAVVAEDASDAMLAQLHTAGVRGLRVNLVDRHDAQGELPLDMLRRLATRIAGLGWHLELLMHVDQHAEELQALTALGVPVVLGHFGYQSIGLGPDHQGFAGLLRALASDRVWVKLTGPYRLTREGPPYAECLPYARLLREAAPHRLLWGTDWPHVMLKGAMPNDAEFVDLLETWLPDAALRQRVLVDNPARLYDFGA